MFNLVCERWAGLAAFSRGVSGVSLLKCLWASAASGLADPQGLLHPQYSLPLLPSSGRLPWAVINSSSSLDFLARRHVLPMASVTWQSLGLVLSGCFIGSKNQATEKLSNLFQVVKLTKISIWTEFHFCLWLCDLGVMLNFNTKWKSHIL